MPVCRPPSPLEWNSSPSLVAAVFNALYGGTPPGSGRIGVIFFCLTDFLGFRLRRWHRTRGQAHIHDRRPWDGWRKPNMPAVLWGSSGIVGYRNLRGI